MDYKLQRWVWSKIFSLDRLLSGLSKLMARLEKLAALRRSEVSEIDKKIASLKYVQRNKEHEADRADRVKSRFEALIQ